MQESVDARGPAGRHQAVDQIDVQATKGRGAAFVEDADQIDGRIAVIQLLSQGRGVEDIAFDQVDILHHGKLAMAMRVAGQDQALAATGGEAVGNVASDETGTTD